MIKLRNLKSSKAISALFNRGNSVIANDLFAKFIYFNDTESDGDTGLLIAYSVPKKRIASAVDRNRIKRLLRVTCREILKIAPIQIQDGRLEMIIVYKSQKLKDYHTILKDTETIFNKISRKLQGNR